METSVVLGVEGTSYLFVGFLIDGYFCFILLEEIASFSECIFLIIFSSMLIVHPHFNRENVDHSFLSFLIGFLCLVEKKLKSG